MHYTEPTLFISIQSCLKILNFLPNTKYDMFLEALLIFDFLLRYLITMHYKEKTFLISNQTCLKILNFPANTKYDISLEASTSRLSFLWDRHISNLPTRLPEFDLRWLRQQMIYIKRYFEDNYVYGSGHLTLFVFDMSYLFYHKLPDRFKAVLPDHSSSILGVLVQLATDRGSAQFFLKHIYLFLKVRRWSI